MSNIRIHLDGTFTAQAAVDDDGLAALRAVVRAKGLSPNSARGQAMMEQLQADMPRTGRRLQVEVTPDVAAYQKQLTAQRAIVKALSNEVAKQEAKGTATDYLAQKLDEKQRQLAEAEQKLVGLERSVRRAKSRKP